MKISPVGTEMFHANRQTDRETRPAEQQLFTTVPKTQGFLTFISKRGGKEVHIN
jgi:hypothetical protein